MTTDFSEYVNKFQEDTLKAVKQAQDVNVAAMQQAQELFSGVAAFRQMPSIENFPAPSKFVELTFDFAGKMLELRKQYALEVAQMFAPNAPSNN